jgi:AraC-like DNA-binding protein
MKSERQVLYKPATRCRIYAWPFEQLYFGCIPKLGIVQYSSPVLRLGLGGYFYLRFNQGAWIKCRCIFIPAGVTHEVFPAKGVIAKYWVEKESIHYPLFCHQLLSSSESVENQKFKKRIVAVFQHIYEKELSSEKTIVHLDKLFHFQGSVKQTLDPRILKISEIIRSELDYNLSIEHLASEVDLSSSRLLHLIKEETGTSYRKFRMWQRLRYAISIFGSTHSLTYAGVEAGFHDASHFSRCFKARYGVSPSVIHNVLEIYEVSGSERKKI